MDIRLMFWVEGELASKFLCGLIPQSGQVWHVPRGDHNLKATARETVVVKVLLVEITPYPEMIDVNIKAEYTERYEPWKDRRQ